MKESAVKGESSGSRRLVLVTALNGVASLAPQLVGLVTLASREFGIFSIVYLTFAFASSMILSVIGDAWVVVTRSLASTDYSVYASLLWTLSFVFGLFGFLVTLVFTGSIGIAALGFGAVFGASVRVGLRYLLMYTRRWNAAMVCDGVFIAGLFVAFIAAALLGVSALLSMIGAWGFASVLSLLPEMRLLRGFRFVSAFGWAKDNRKAIRPLMADTLAMDISAIGTPYVLLVFMGLSGFGTYRAISNMSSPIRLLVAPFRPLIIKEPSVWRTDRRVFQAYGAGVVGGITVTAILYLLPLSGLQLGVLIDLAPYALATGVYVFSTVLLTIYPLICRGLENPRHLYMGRVCQTSFGILGPVVGFVGFGLEGAIWGFAFSSLISGLIWHALVARPGREEGLRVA